jgi:chemotaxis protein MotB
MVECSFRITIMSLDESEHKHQIIIVRRGNDDHDDGHHGGVWKIAFADFMTAMMCFFLVMWLITASDDQVKASIANYFNPVRLVDHTTGQQGLNDLGDGPNSVGTSAEKPEEPDGKAGVDGKANAGPAEATNASDLSETEERSDRHLFADPYAVLAEIAADTGRKQNISAKGDGGAQDAGPATGASGGEAYRDPFAPDFWSQHVAPRQEAAGESAKPDAVIETAPKQEARPPREKPSEADAAKDAARATAKGSEPAEAQQVPGKSKDGKEAPGTDIAKAAQKIKQELAEAFKAGDKLYDGISVTPTDKGVQISVTDQLDFGMFEIGSAVPRGELVLAMEKIGKTLSGRLGKIMISGHTDGRPFKSETYDNWRLSTARAHAAHYMLVRAGLDERRVTEVSGFADRQLKVPEDPYAAANRRIDILLETNE